MPASAISGSCIFLEVEWDGMYRHFDRLSISRFIHIVSYSGRYKLSPDDGSVFQQSAGLKSGGMSQSVSDGSVLVRMTCGM